MDDRDWRLLKDVFHRALECGPDERARLLDEACAGNAEVRADIEELLRVHARREPDARAPDLSHAVEGADLAGAPREIGEYRIVGEIGRGGMGVVYEAVQVPMQRRVALKVLSASVLHSPRAIERFQREARAAGKLHHTNIVPIHAMGQHAGLWYYAMELVDGRALNHVVAELKQVRDREDGDSVSKITSEHLGTDTGDRAYFPRVARMFAEVADALETAHTAGVIHRDIKPSNLLLDGGGRLMVVDFGLARLDDGEASMTLTGDLLGTPIYMSPEQALAKRMRIDHRTDVYSLGATLYEVLTLEPPYRGETLQDICAQIVTKDPPLPGRINRHLPKDLETVVFKAMEKDRDKRYTTAGELALDLRRFADGASIQARRIGPLGRAWRKVKRHKVRSSLVATAAVLAALAAVFAARAAHEAERFARLEYARLCAEAEVPMREAVVGAIGGPHVSTGDWLPLGAESPTAAGNDARALLTRAITLIPDRFEAYLARALVPGSKLAERMDDLQRARDRGMPPRVFHLARAYLLTASGRWREADAERAQAAAYPDRTPTDAYFEARLLGMAGERAEALPLLEGAIRDTSPQSLVRYLALYHRAHSRFDDGDFAGALEDLTLVQGLDEGSIATRVFAARCWRKLDKPELAERLFGETRERVRAQNTVAAWVEMCAACEGERDWRDAVTQEALAKHGDSLALIEARGYYLIRAGEFQRARELCESALKEAPDSSELYWLLGSTLRELGQYEEALDALGKALDLDPNSLAINARGLVLVKLRRYEEALKDFDRAIEHDPLRATLHSNRGVVLRTLGRFDEARAAHDQAIRLDIAYAHAYACRGGLLADEFNELDLALADFDKAIELDPRSYLAHLNRGTVLWRKGDRDAALRALDRAVESAPWLGAARRKRAGILAQMGRVEEARAEIAKGLEAYPDGPDMLEECGYGYVDLGMHEESIAVFRKASRLSPGKVALFVHWAASLLTLRRYEEALEVYEMAIKVAPDDWWVHHMRSYTLRNLGRLDEALAAGRRAVELRPQEPDTHNGLAIALLASGMTAEALAVCERALASHPDHAQLHAHRGIALQELGRKDSAMAEFRRASELDEQLWVPRWRLADLLFEAGRFEEALEAAQEAARIIPNNSGIWNMIANVYLRLRKWEDSVEASRRALGAVPDRSDSRAQTYLHMGFALRALRRHGEALAVLRKADPRDPQVETNIGDVLTDMGRHEEAVDAYREALKSSPHDTNALAGLGDVLDRMGHHDEALDAFTKQAEEAPLDATARLHRGIQLHKLHRNEDAIRDFERATELGGNAARLRFLTGEALTAMHLYERAERAYADALRLDPSMAAARAERAEPLWRLQRFKEALVELEAALQAFPDEADLHARCAFVLAHLGRFADAEQRLRRALELAPESPGTLEVAVWTLVLMGKFPDALVAAERVPEAVAARVYCARAMGHEGQARKVAAAAEPDGSRPLEHAYVHAVAGRREKALALIDAYDKPWQPLPMLWRARVHAVLGDKDAAIEWLGKAIDKGLSRPAKAAPDPDLASLKSDSRFEDLRARLYRDAGG